MCIKLALRPDPDGPISIRSRPVDGRPPPSPRSARMPPSSHRWAYIEERSPRTSKYYVEERSPRLSSHSTLPVDLVERTPKSPGRAPPSPRIVQERSPRSSSHSHASFPPRAPPIEIPPHEPYVSFPGTHLYPGSGPSPDSLRVPPLAPRVPRGQHHRHTSSASTTISSVSSASGSLPRERRYRASSSVTSPLSDSFESREQDVPRRHASGRRSRDGSNLGSERGGLKSPQIHQQSHHQHHSEQSASSRIHAEGTRDGAAPPLPLEDPATARRAQLAEERVLLGGDGRRRTQYHYR